MSEFNLEYIKDFISWDDVSNNKIDRDYPYPLMSWANLPQENKEKMTIKEQD